MKLRTLLIFCSFVSYGVAACYKVPCDQAIEMTKQQNIQILQQAYDSLNASMDTMFQLEDEYKAKLEEQNDLLDKIEILEKEGLTNEKNLLILIKQNNQILDKTIDIDLSKKTLQIEK